jgi:hypothetical protein
MGSARVIQEKQKKDNIAIRRAGGGAGGEGSQDLGAPDGKVFVRDGWMDRG